MYCRKSGSASESRSGIGTSSWLAGSMSSGNPPVNSPRFLQWVPNRCPSDETRTMSALKGQFGITCEESASLWISYVDSPVHAGIDLEAPSLELFEAFMLRWWMGEGYFILWPQLAVTKMSHHGHVANPAWKILIRCVKTSFSWREDCNMSTVRDVQINKCYESKLIVLFMIPAADYLIWMLPWSQESLWRVKSRQGNTQSSKSVESLMNRLGNERVENSLPPSLNNCCLNFSKDPLTFDTRLIINV